MRLLTVSVEYKKFEVKPEWADLPDDEVKEDDAPAFIKELVRPINAQAGDLLKVSDFVKHGTVDGSWMVGTAAYEKRGVEAFVPVWEKDNCIQCNQCAYVCPHAAIRPFVLTDDELKGFDNIDSIEMKAPAAMRACTLSLSLRYLTVWVAATVPMSVLAIPRRVRLLP